MTLIITITYSPGKKCSNNDRKPNFFLDFPYFSNVGVIGEWEKFL